MERCWFLSLMGLRKFRAIITQHARVKTSPTLRCLRYAASKRALLVSLSTSDCPVSPRGVVGNDILMATHPQTPIAASRSESLRSSPHSGVCGGDTLFQAVWEEICFNHPQWWQIRKTRRSPSSYLHDARCL